MSQRRAATRMRMFADIERMDAHAWASYLAPDAVMRFGNDDPIYGRDGCRSALEAFYARIDGLRYDLVELWEHGEATIVEANVTYTRSDGPAVTCRWSRSTAPTPTTSSRTTASTPTSRRCSPGCRQRAPPVS